MPSPATRPAPPDPRVLAAWLTDAVLWDIAVRAAPDRRSARAAYLAGLEMDRAGEALEVAVNHPAAAGLVGFAAIAFG